MKEPQIINDVRSFINQQASIYGLLYKPPTHIIVSEAVMNEVIDYYFDKAYEEANDLVVLSTPIKIKGIELIIGEVKNEK